MNAILSVLALALATGPLSAQTPTVDWRGDSARRLLPIVDGWAPSPRRAAPRLVAPEDSLSGMASLSCSGVVVRIGNDPDARALLLSNGHCYDMLEPDTFVANQPYQRSVSLFRRDNSRKAYRADQLVYATLTGTDLSLMRLNATYRELVNAGIDSYEISGEPARPGDAIIVASGYFSSTQRCAVDKIVHRLRESRWEWANSYKLRGCRADHGMSGSPLISVATRKVVGVLNTGNDSGGRCSFNNPCEVDADGRVTVEQGSAYAQRIDAIASCIDSRGAFDVNTPTCGLFRGRRAPARTKPQGWM